MARFQEDFKTLKQALNDVYKVYELKDLARNFNKKFPARKSELIDYITSTVFADLKAVISKLSPLSANALAEAVHNWNGKFRAESFYAKYGDMPAKRYTEQNQMDLFYLFFINKAVPADLMSQLQRILKPPAPGKIHYESLPEKHDLMVRKTANESCINLHTLLFMVNEKKNQGQPQNRACHCCHNKKNHISSL